MPGRPIVKTGTRPPRRARVQAADMPGVLRGPDAGLTTPELQVYGAVRAAIIEQRLPPGAKLAEEELAGLYGISRMRVRRVLLSLSHARVVTLFPGRGAFVCKPTPAEARAVFDARRLLETAVLNAMDRAADPALLGKLRRNVTASRSATRRQDWAEAIQLSGAFHIHLMSALGNPVIAGIAEELVARSSIVLTLYRRGSTPVCHDDEHAAIIGALGSSEGFREAAALMRHHMEEIEASLDFSDDATPPRDLRSALLGGKP